MWKPKLNFQKETKIEFLGGKQKWNFGRIPKYKFKPEIKNQILGGKRDLKLSRKPKIVKGIQNFIKENKKWFEQETWYLWAIVKKNSKIWFVWLRVFRHDLVRTIFKNPINSFKNWSFDYNLFLEKNLENSYNIDTFIFNTAKNFLFKLIVL